MQNFKNPRWVNILIVFISILLISSITYGGAATKLFDTSGAARGITIADDGTPIVYEENQSFIPADYYLYQTVATPVISTTATIDDEVIQVVSSTGVIAGHVMTIYEGNQMFQTLVTDTTATSISMSNPIDFAFTADALVEAGLWSMNVDGSSTTQIFSIKAPPTGSIHMHALNISMLSSVVMDDAKFGGRAALPNGILFRYTNSIKKNLAVVVNNLGFWEIGFDLVYSDKAPAGVYGLRARRNILAVDGTIVILGSGGMSELQIHIRDDLSDEDLFAAIINGHMKND